MNSPYTLPDPVYNEVPTKHETGQINSRWIGFYIVCSLIFLLLFNLNHAFQFWCFLLLRPFMHGISSFKINALFFYTALLGLLLLFTKPVTALAADKLKKWLAAIIGCASVTALMTFFQVVLKFNLPLGRYAYFFSGGQSTINDLSHTHTTKIVMYYLCRMLGLDAISERLDTALPLVPHVHPALALVHGALILSALVLLVLAAGAVMQRWDRRCHRFIFPLYIFASAHCIKCLIDGGPCAYDFMPAVLCLHLLLSARDEESLRYVVRKYALCYSSLLLLAPLVTIGICFDSAGLQPALGTLFHVCLYAAGFLLLLRKKRFPAAAAIAACCLYSVLYFTATAVNDVMAFSQRISAADLVIHAAYPVPADMLAEARMIDCSREMRGKSVREAYESLGENPLRNRNTAIAIHQQEQHDVRGFIFGLVVIRGEKTVHFASDEYISVGSVIASQRIKNAVLMRVTFNRKFFPELWEPRGSIIVENNRFAALYYLNHYLRSHGISEYILIPFNFVETAAH